MNTSLDFDFAKMLEDSIDDKINQSTEEMHEYHNEYHNPIFNQSLSIEIEALEWVQLQIEDLVNGRVKKDKLN